MAKAIGYVVLTFNFDLEFGGLEGLVTDLFIIEKYRGHGLGKRALDVVDDYCRSREIGTVELQVTAENKEAQAFYRRIGFEQLSRVVMARDVRAGLRRAQTIVDRLDRGLRRARNSSLRRV